ncbi:response regulator [Paenibacillus algorifonticola]|uniref:response regulator transcription factor n=1 Tax=Paenibacillus algorifonticola TaxID=684063 RepID=UPI003D2C71C1
MTYKVLLIDDEPGALEGMQLWIDWNKLGFEVCGTCSNGLEGLQQIQEQLPDLVVTDVHMPIMDGLEMIAAWRQRHSKKVSFMIVSGYSDFEYAQRAMRYGINHYLLKPIIQEEAEMEIEGIRRELTQEVEKQSFDQIATYEETVALIKEWLAEQSMSKEAVLSMPLITLSVKREKWNFYLVQADAFMFAELRETAAALLAPEPFMFLIDLEENSFGIVYGYTIETVDENRACLVIDELMRRYAGRRLFVAAGMEESSLLSIGSCLRTAKQAIAYLFYRTDYNEVVYYSDIQNKPFHYHYDIHLMDDVLRAIELLHKSSLQEAVQAAASSFRETLIAPDIVKKIVIHLLYRIIEYVRETIDTPDEAMLEKYSISEISSSVLHIHDLLSRLLVCGEKSIELLSKEQTQKSQGIVQKINGYIQEHFRENLTIKKLGEVFYLNPVYLGQLLMKKNGLGFNESVHDLRIAEAVSLLEHNKLKNCEIAERVGYSNYSHFLKEFEKRLGMSPNKYKNNKL